MPKNYTTKQGDAWDKIALDFYGTEAGMNTILEANQQYSEYVIFPAGLVLIIPEYTKPLPSALPPWRR